MCPVDHFTVVHVRCEAPLQHAEQEGFLCGDECCSRRSGSQQGRGEDAGCSGRAAGAAFAEGQAERHGELGAEGRPRGARLLCPGRPGGSQHHGGWRAAPGGHADSPEATAGRTVLNFSFNKNDHEKFELRLWCAHSHLKMHHSRLHYISNNFCCCL